MPRELKLKLKHTPKKITGLTWTDTTTGHKSFDVNSQSKVNTYMYLFVTMVRKGAMG